MTGRTRSSRISKSDGHGSRYPPCENRAGWGTHSFVEPKEQGWATRRRPLLASPARRDLFLRTLERTRRQYLFTVVGYVIMPEHVHLLVSEPQRQTLAVALKALKQSMARRVAGGPPFPYARL